MIAVLRHFSCMTLLALGLGLAGCANDAPTSSVEPTEEVSGPMVGPRWNLLLVGTSERLELSPTPYFQIGADGRVSGHDGCNAFKSNVSLGDNQRIEFGQLASTRKACPDMQDAQRVTAMLDDAYRYLIDHGRLVFFGPDQRVLGGFRRVD
ncbi:META domain-containing protein [Halomonas sp. 18H]|uniref:META domain-containing protein n=1 Tax=Halomonas almeriensis TaxID=308163 RepID=UPI002230A761|nr:MULTISPECIES: META domain-containing protein [Halomonas]MCW4152536.1 META domain-containing protein [Halomonas sp. 18H]MDN3553888.1 META domain-containing protein [Halomonas almeriensis]